MQRRLICRLGRDWEISRTVGAARRSLSVASDAGARRSKPRSPTSDNQGASQGCFKVSDHVGPSYSIVTKALAPASLQLTCAQGARGKLWEDAIVSRRVGTTAADGDARSGSRTDGRALAAASVTVVLWASSFIVIRSSAAHFGPGALAFGRLAVASIVLSATLLARCGGFPPREAWRGIVASGVLWFGAYTVALNWGEHLVDAGTASLIVNVGPILMALLGGWLLKEGFPPKLMAGMVVSFVGAVVVGLSMSGGGESSLVGVLLCLFAAVVYAVGVVVQKPTLKHATPMQVTTFGVLAGAVACLPFAGQLASQVSQAPVPATLQMVYLGVFPTALACTMWAYAISRTTAGKMGATTYAVPVLVVFMSWLFLGEVPTWLTLLGGLLCLSGVAVSRMRGKAQVQVPEGARRSRAVAQPDVSAERTR
jgi:drug/metabolite transporter (DMT)-like permease